MGAVEERIIEQAVMAGDALPDRIQNAPQLLRGLSLYYNAFQDLTTTRQSGFGIGPISWQAINDYCLTYGIDGEQREDMFFHIVRLDAAYREHVDKKHKLETGRNNDGQGTPKRPAKRPMKKRGR